MKTAAIICEYNPFHRGHAKQIAFLRETFGEDLAVVAIMSGNFVQRGGPAIYPKEARAAVALRGGADLVLELPYPWCAAVGERFAAAGVHIAGAIGADCLCFGHESDFSLLREAADYKWEPTVRHSESSIRAREEAFRQATGNSLPAGANDRLAIEYLRAMGNDPAAASLVPLPLLREADGYSAHAAREAILARKDCSSIVPEPCALSPATLEKGYPALSVLLRSADPHELSALFDLPYEIALRMITAAGKYPDDFTAFFTALRSKNDTDARLRRCLITALLRPLPQDGAALPCWTQLLAASVRGKALLRKLRRNGGFPIVTKRADAPEGRQKLLSLRADAQYGLFSGKNESVSDILARKPQFED